MVYWSPEDVMHAAHDQGFHPTPEQAAAMLEDFESALKDAMISAGWDALETLISDHLIDAD